VNYRVVIANRAKKELEAVPSTVLEAIEEKTLSLGKVPRPPACKKLKGDEKTWRIRSGKYRILCQIDDSAKVVTVVGSATERTFTGSVIFLPSCELRW
jgi:mRNA interferase RelE/StbE